VSKAPEKELEPIEIVSDVSSLQKRDDLPPLELPIIAGNFINNYDNWIILINTYILVPEYTSPFKPEISGQILSKVSELAQWDEPLPNGRFFCNKNHDNWYFVII